MTTATARIYERAAEDVECGADLLDLHSPGWHKRINLDQLNTDDPCDCVLGQLYAPASPIYRAGYFVGIDDLGIDQAEVYQYGFDIPDEESAAWPALDEAWGYQIEKRRDAGDLARVVADEPPPE